MLGVCADQDRAGTRNFIGDPASSGHGSRA
jgi:hypothetical protein